MRVCIARSNRRVGSCLAAIAASLLAGCMGNLEDVLARREVEREALAKTTADRVTASASCCANYRAITFRPMPLGLEQEVVLSASSPVFDFPFGRSRFEAFELPPLTTG